MPTAPAEEDEMNAGHDQAAPLDEQVKRILEDNEAGVGALLDVYQRAEAQYTAAAATVWSQTTYATTTS